MLESLQSALNAFFGFSLNNSDYAILGGALFVVIQTTILFFKHNHNPFKYFRWPVSKAVVISSDVVKSMNRVDGFGAGNTHTRQIEIYTPQIQFEYDFKGRKYQSSTYSPFITSNADRRYAEEIAKQYNPGRRFDCYVNPENPEQAYIEVSKGNVAMFAAALLFFIVGFPVAAYVLVLAKHGAL